MRHAIVWTSVSLAAFFHLALAAHGQGTGYFSPNCDDLSQVDLLSGVETFIGPIGTEIRSLAISPAAELFAIDTENDELLRIDPVTGLGTTVGGLQRDLRFAGDMSFDETGRLWLFGSEMPSDWLLYEVDSSTGEATRLGEVDGVAFGAPLTALGSSLITTSGGVLQSIDRTSLTLQPLSSPQSGGGVFMDFAEDGSLWWYVRSVPIAPPPPPRLTGVDIAGSVLADHAGVYICAGLAIAPPLPFPDDQVIPIPTLTTMGSLILSLVLLLAGFFFVSRTAH